MSIIISISIVMSKINSVSMFLSQARCKDHTAWPSAEEKNDAVEKLFVGPRRLFVGSCAVW